MNVVISMLRGVNLGPHKRMKMEDLRAMYAGLGLRDPRTIIQSGNVVFRTKECDLAKLTSKIEKAIEKTFGFTSDVVLRSAAEMRDVIARNPCSSREGIDPAKLLVTFLAAEPVAGASDRLQALAGGPEELWLSGRELFTHYPNGQGKTQLPWAKIDRALGVSGTARNLNSVLKLLAMAEEMEGLTKPSSEPRP